jgi:hypothetical protein
MMTGIEVNCMPVGRPNVSGKPFNFVEKGRARTIGAVRERPAVSSDKKGLTRDIGPRDSPPRDEGNKVAQPSHRGCNWLP